MSASKLSKCLATPSRLESVFRWNKKESSRLVIVDTRTVSLSLLRHRCYQTSQAKNRTIMS